MYKTQMCKFHHRGDCYRGEECTYAHDVGELRELQLGPRYKTVICLLYTRGYCHHGAKCRFAHGQHELRRGAADTMKHEEAPPPVRMGDKPVKPMPKVRETCVTDQHHVVPDSFCCPITQEPFKRPVVAMDGHSYEQHALQSWFDRCKGRPISPMTNQPMCSTFVVPNRSLLTVLEDWTRLVMMKL